MRPFDLSQSSREPMFQFFIFKICRSDHPAVATYDGQRSDRIGEPMSAFGTKQTSRDRVPMSAFAGKADIPSTSPDVRF
jgi:hypothetical protein